MRQISPSPTSHDASAHDITSFQIKTADLGRRHIDVIFTRQEVFTTDKSKPIRHNLQDSVRLDAAVQLLKFIFQILMRAFSTSVRVLSICCTGAVRSG